MNLLFFFCFSLALADSISLAFSFFHIGRLNFSCLFFLSFLCGGVEIRSLLHLWERTKQDSASTIWRLSWGYWWLHPWFVPASCAQFPRGWFRRLADYIYFELDRDAEVAKIINNVHTLCDGNQFLCPLPPSEDPWAWSELKQSLCLLIISANLLS